MNQPYVAAIDIGAPVYVQHHGVKEWSRAFAALTKRPDSMVRRLAGRIRPALRRDGQFGNAEAAQPRASSKFFPRAL